MNADLRKMREVEKAKQRALNQSPYFKWREAEQQKALQRCYNDFLIDSDGVPPREGEEL